MGRQADIRELGNYRPRSRWAEQITTAWSDQLEDIFHTGDLIEAAKLELPHGEFLKMVKDELPFGRSAANKLVKVATNDNLRNAEFVTHLPVSWGTLYHLTLLTDEQFSAAVESGMIHPRMTVKDAKALRGEPEKKPETPPAAKCVSRVKRAVTAALKQLPPEEWNDLFRKLRGVIDDIDEEELGDGHHAARQSA